MMMLLDTCLHRGSEGVPLPYSPRMDDGMAVLLLGCFFLSAYVLSRSSKFLLQLVKDFLLNRERTSIFAMSTASDMRYLLLLILQTCLLEGVFIFNYYQETSGILVNHLAPYTLLAAYVSISILMVCAKWLTYSVLGWIFFDKNKTALWLESYSTLQYYIGFILFPLVLFIVYFDLDIRISTVLALFLFIFVKILMLYKYLKLFCDNLYGCSLLFLYFCALEIVPYLVLYRGIEQLNDYLIIKF